MDEEARGDEPFFLDEPRRRAEEAQAELKRLIKQIELDQQQHLNNIREIKRLLHSQPGTVIWT